MGLKPARRYETAKAGNRPDECEDASLTVYPANAGPARIAICDGASESAFARDWAQILANALVRRPLDLNGLDETAFSGWLEQCEGEWNSVVPWDRIPWHGEAKTRSGALATALGVEVDLAPGGSGGYPWRAVAVGDCCLFVVRDNELALSFPMLESGQFNSTPPLICSNPVNNGGIWSALHQRSGEFVSGDLVILATDALGCWILQEQEAGRRPWEVLQSLDSPAEWEAWVETQRTHRAMRNDDTTLVMVEVE